MYWPRAEAIGVGALLVAASGCGGGDRAEVSFSESEVAAPVPVVVIKGDSSRTEEGYRVAELHVLLPPATGEAAARATLQHLIDSIAAADTMAAAVRVTGFVVDSLDPVQGTADILPAIRAIWGPIDTAGYTGAHRRSRYRTDYLLIRPLDQTASNGRVP